MSGSLGSSYKLATAADSLEQGRIFSYLDTQLNRNGGPNFEQLPINRPVVPIRNNNRDGMGQGFIHRNTAACK
jgi:catalase